MIDPGEYRSGNGLRQVRIRKDRSMNMKPPHSLKRFAMVAVRLLAAISLLAVGAVHIQQYIVVDYRGIPTIGPLFLLNFIGGTVLGLYFLVPVSRNASRFRLSVDAVAA